MNWSLVLELAEKRKTEKERLLKSLAGYLKTKGVNATTTEVSAPVSGQKNPALELTGKNINSIEVKAEPYNSCGQMVNVYRFIYLLKTEHRLSHEDNKQINARLVPVRKHSVPGNGGGAVGGAKWQGDELAEKLNHDDRLTAIFLNAAKQAYNTEVEIHVRDTSTIEIAGPWFMEPPQFLEPHNGSAEPTGQDTIYLVETYEGIAEYIRKAIGTSQIPETKK